MKKINSIQIIENKIRIYPKYSFYYLKDIIKVKKQPLFTTEDGVDIFESDEYYQIHYPENWEITKGIAEKIINYINLIESKVLYSTKEKAEEYMLLNKPCLSLNDLLNYQSATKQIFVPIKTLKDLVKSKIQHHLQL